MAAGSARERLLDAASRLFYANGMVATGIDAVTTEAGVAKMSLYNNFSSKEDLMLAYIEARHEEWLQLYRNRVEHAASAVDGVLAVFDAYIDHASAAYPRGFRGCGLLNAAAELPAGSAGRDAVCRHKEQVEGILTGHLLALAPAPAAREAAEHLSFLLEGAMSRAGLEGRPDRLVRAKDIARAVIEAL
ncbi:TetR/AcrR family transcriptional regulator [Arthrobacter sp. GCM10027362]|uniref:TetR/AcrR family transcriptional regulator n=1 Tax=Arthrobacter sp. GCM10027362 TaxID=3273379 RepID=UPI00363E7F87